MMEKRKLYNPDANDRNYNLIEGESTGILNLSDAKYQWAINIIRIMLNNFWIPEKVNLKNDVNSFLELSPEEREVYQDILSFLIYLDSLQVGNLPNIGAFIKAPEVVYSISLQTQQEAIHSKSYSSIVDTVIPKEKRRQIYYRWKDNPILFKRNSYIVSHYQRFLDEPSFENYGRVLISNLILEGLYFYNGFNFFYNLASRGLMLGTADMIKYIHKDENTHVTLFRYFISDLTDEVPNHRFLSKDTVYELFKEAVEQELSFSKYTLGNKIMGINEESIEDYTYYLANNRLKLIGLDPIFPDRPNPYKHLERIADVESEGTCKTNFFEATVTSYNQHSAIEGWEEI